MTGLQRLCSGIALLATGCVGIVEGIGADRESPAEREGAGRSSSHGMSGTGGAPGPGTVGMAGNAGGTMMPGAAIGMIPMADNVTVDFFRDIQPILGDYCVRCHGGVREMGHLNLQSRERAARILGSAGSSASLLMLRVTMTDPNLRMPLGGPALPTDQLEKLRRWTAMGAPWPQHWAFAPLEDIQPSTVAVREETWVRSPVDRFVLQRLEQAGIVPSPEADRPRLIRRVSLDLTGLPPTPNQVDDFVADTSATAFEKVVDRLLTSPGFGERWGRHWLDQARYADSDGYEKDLARPNAWRWRDWVVEAFNKDMPFDQFTIEQIAGDLLPGATPMHRLATGFHNQTLVNREDGTDAEEDRVKRVIDRVATVGNAWLGLSLQCTQCHSHAYDRLAQKEFYRLYAFFNNADESTATVPMGANAPDTQTLNAAVMTERVSNRRTTYLLTRGDFLNPDRAAGALIPGTLSTLQPFMARASTPDRLDLARWLIDAKNPLTPRVAVNTIWYHLFGEGIVTTLDDWGIRASYPSHPELLDWLAGDFVSNGWRRKRVIRQIVLSATYRQSSDLREREPGNALLYRQNRVRVEAEIVTDLSLAVSGLLTDKVGGPTVYPPLQDELRELIKGPYSNFQWVDSKGPDRYRRGLYTFHKRTVLYPNLQIFNRPLGDVSVNGRGRSTTPLQALTTLHNPLFDEAAQALARRVQVERPGDLRTQLIWAIKLALARVATEPELTELQGIFRDSKALYDANLTSAQQAVGVYQPPGVNAGDAAAWVATARAIMNLDEFITRE